MAMTATSRKYRLCTLAAVGVCALFPLISHGENPLETLSIGRAASAADIARWDIDVGPDGTGLPPGNGTAQQGETVYAEKCANCHGPDGRRGRDKLTGTPGETRKKNVGNYWPYATTLFDYIRRAMPADKPGSLTNTEVYALTAYILHLNSIITTEEQINADTLPKIAMPAQARFVPDNRSGGAEIR
jgi:mono/diheme cytochrome c family protein